MSLARGPYLTDTTPSVPAECVYRGNSPEAVLHQDIRELLCDLQHNLSILFALNAECVLKQTRLNKPSCQSDCNIASYFSWRTWCMSGIKFHAVSYRSSTQHTHLICNMQQKSAFQYSQDKRKDLYQTSEKCCESAVGIWAFRSHHSVAAVYRQIVTVTSAHVLVSWVHSKSVRAHEQGSASG